MENNNVDTPAFNFDSNSNFNTPTASSVPPDKTEPNKKKTSIIIAIFVIFAIIAGGGLGYMLFLFDISVESNRSNEITGTAQSENTP